MSDEIRLLEGAREAHLAQARAGLRRVRMLEAEIDELLRQIDEAIAKGRRVAFAARQGCR